MPPIYQIGPDDDVDELELELEYQASLTVEQRYKMMINASRTVLKMLIDNGYKNLLKLLNDHNVKYVIIGAFAFPFYGYSRTTIDVDIFIEPSKENAANTRKALSEFGYDLTTLSDEDILSKKTLIRQYIQETDIHPYVTGVTFEKVWQNKVEGKVEGIETYFASLDDLIKMKQASGRDKDFQDLAILKRLKNRNNG